MITIEAFIQILFDLLFVEMNDCFFFLQKLKDITIMRKFLNENRLYLLFIDRLL